MMKKGTSKNKKLSLVKPNQKISSYFSKIEKPPSHAPSNPAPSRNANPEVVCISDSDNDDFIKNTPGKKFNSVKKISNDSKALKITTPKRNMTSRSSPAPKANNPSALETITNLSQCSTVSSPIVLTPETKKRKHSQENTPSPEIIPCSLNPIERKKFQNCSVYVLPARKKSAKGTNSVSVEDDSGLSAKELSHLYSPSKNNADVKLFSPKLRCKSPEELINQKLTFSPIKNLIAIASSYSRTPEKPNKNPSPRKSGQKTPGKQTSPAKLFDRSPKSGTFNVEVMENFVKITPSKSDANHRSSPVNSGRSAETQKQNESTPPKSHQKSCSRISPQMRVRTKLDFGFNGEEPDDIDESLSKCMLNDSWDDKFDMANETFDLNLTESQHCKVLKVERSTVDMQLSLQSTKDERSKALCNIKGFWLEIQINVNDTLHLSAVYDRNKSVWVIDNNRGLIVLEPDYLISTTSIVGALFCKRRSIFRERYRGFDSSNRHMIVGILVHQLLQEVLRHSTASVNEIEDILKKLLSDKNTIMSCYACSVPIEEIHQELSQFIPRIVVFMKQYVLDRRNGEINSINKENWKGKIDSIRDIEENIWCPELGIKGKVDVSIQSGMTVMPLELKTGRATVSLEHRGQVMFYIMMMNKFGYTVPSGLLLYLREGVLREIKVSDNERRDLLILRNQLTYYLMKKPSIEYTNTKDQSSKGTLLHSGLPEPINHHNACSKCPYNTVCCTYLKYEEWDLSNNPLGTVQNDVLANLEPAHLRYFIKWSSLLALEASCEHGNKQLHEIYTVPPEQREKNGQCITNVRLKETVTQCGDLFGHTFEKIAGNDCVINLRMSGINVGDYVVISTSARPAIATGFATDMDRHTITITLDRDISKRYSKRELHLDTYNSNISQTFNMSNLSLLLGSDERAAKLRRIIIDKTLPSFGNVLPKSVAIKGTPILRMLNKMQQKAVLNALSANDYLLIKGMPGTGKTATIVALIQLLVEINKTVLITSHTHSAVDNVCVRLLENGIKVLRLGSDSKINSKLHSYTENTLIQNCKTPEEIEEVYNKANILAVTCLGSGHPVLNKRRFDICIVDESTQVLQCSVFRVLYCADKFVLIGDPDQLPPVVKNQEASARGLSESLFERLDVPKATVTLTLNYRMNKSITAMANSLTYQDQLLIANDSVANAVLHLPNEKKFLATYNRHSWVIQALDQTLSAAVKILDTGPVWNRLSQQIEDTCNSQDRDEESNRCTNRCETAIVSFLVEALLMAGVSSDMVGVIAPYRAQVAQLSSALNSKNVEVSTVDQFQGRDKEIILYSCTKTSDRVRSSKKSEYAILEDKRRLTVAITRAKRKFILIGDLATIKQYSPFAKLLQSLNDECFIKLEDGRLGFDWNVVTNVEMFV